MMRKTLIYNRNLIKLSLLVFLAAFFIAGCPEEEKAISMDNPQEPAIEAKKSQDKPENQDYEQVTFAAGNPPYHQIVSRIPAQIASMSACPTP